MLTIFTHVWSHFKFNVKLCKTVLRIECRFYQMWLPIPIMSIHQNKLIKLHVGIANQCCRMSSNHHFGIIWKGAKWKKKRIKQLELSCWVTTRMDSEWFIWRLGENWIFWNFLWGCSIKLHIYGKNSLSFLENANTWKKMI